MDDVIWFGKPTVLSFASLFAGTILGLLSIVAIEGFLEPPFSWVPTLGLGAALLIVNFAFNRARSTTYTISAVDVHRECHYVTDEFNELPLNKIADVVVSRGALGRILHFGTVKVNSASVSFHNIVLTGVRKPEEVRRIILAAKETALANKHTTPLEGCGDES